jgi:hypothetical protein
MSINFNTSYGSHASMPFEIGRTKQSNDQDRIEVTLGPGTTVQMRPEVNRSATVELTLSDGRKESWNSDSTSPAMR